MSWYTCNVILNVMIYTYACIYLKLNTKWRKDLKIP